MDWVLLDNRVDQTYQLLLLGLYTAAEKALDLLMFHSLAGSRIGLVPDEHRS
jgi:hypothetical protein